MKKYYFEPIFTKVQVEFLGEVLESSGEDAMGGVVGGNGDDDFEDWDSDDDSGNDSGFW